MIYMLVLTGVLALAVAINCISVYVQKHYHFYDTFRHGWLIHTLAILPAWVSFIVLSIPLNEHYFLPLYSFKLGGLAIVVFAVTLFGAAIRKVGIQALSNGNFFAKGKITNEGVYKYIKNPIYNSYWILFVGVGLYFGNWAYFIVAVECFIALNIIETYVERPNPPKIG